VTDFEVLRKELGNNRDIERVLKAFVNMLIEGKRIFNPQFDVRKSCVKRFDMDLIHIRLYRQSVIKKIWNPSSLRLKEKMQRK